MARAFLVLAFLSAGCGDNCEQLCTTVSQELRLCKPDSLSWSDLGALSRQDFVDQCRDQWDRVRTSLTASELRLSLQACQDTQQEIADPAWRCDETLALYGDLE